MEKELKWKIQKKTAPERPNRLSGADRTVRTDKKGGLCTKFFRWVGRGPAAGTVGFFALSPWKPYKVWRKGKKATVKQNCPNKAGNVCPARGLHGRVQAKCDDLSGVAFPVAGRGAAPGKAGTLRRLRK